MVERVHLIKGMNGFTSGGRTRTVSSGYTSDRDFDQVDEGIPVCIVLMDHKLFISA